MKTTKITWVIIIALFFSINATSQIRILDWRLKFDIIDIEKIVKDYETKENSCEGLKSDMKRCCAIEKIMLLTKYKEQILHNYDSTYFQYSDYYFLCFLGTLPDSVVRVGMNSRNVPSVFKAQHGDTASLNTILLEAKQCFLSNTSDEIVNVDNINWPTIISNLLLIHDKKTLAFFYEILKSTKFGDLWCDGVQNYKISVAYIAIQVYLSMYPPKSPISKIDPIQFEVAEGYPINSIKDIDTIKFNQYIKDVEKYISSKEKQNIMIKTKYFHLGEYNPGKWIIYE